MMRFILIGVYGMYDLLCVRFGDIITKKLFIDDRINEYYFE